MVVPISVAKHLKIGSCVEKAGASMTMCCPTSARRQREHQFLATTGVRRQSIQQRNVVERCFNQLEQFRDLATRYAKRAAYYQAELTIAAIILWLR